jgi:hypothetical protein
MFHSFLVHSSPGTDSVWEVKKPLFWTGYAVACASKSTENVHRSVYVVHCKLAVRRPYVSFHLHVSSLTFLKGF